MSTHIYDVDGTLVEWHTNTWLPGALERLLDDAVKGHDILLITMRGPHDEGKEWSPQRTYETILADLRRNGVKHRIVFDVQPHRIIFDDTPPEAVHHPQNSPW